MKYIDQVQQEIYQIDVTALQEIRWSEERTVTIYVYTIFQGGTEITNRSLEQVSQ